MKFAKSGIARKAVAATGIAAALFLTAGNASSSATEPARDAAGRQASAEDACGFFKYWIRQSQFAAYGHCGSTSVRIHVDVSGGGSGNDFHLCVAPGDTLLGAGGNYLNAYYIGGAGCRVGDRSGHTPH